MLLNIVFTSSWVIGGPSDPVDESDAVETVREEDADEFGGDIGILCRGTLWPGTIISKTGE